jgi:hypothetical protein
MLADQGWEPVTKAKTSDPDIFIERYGARTWTIFNNGNSEKRFAISFDELPKVGSGKDLVTGEEFKIDRSTSLPRMAATLKPGDCRVMRF